MDILPGSSENADRLGDEHTPRVTYKTNPAVHKSVRHMVHRERTFVSILAQSGT